MKASIPMERTSDVQVPLLSRTWNLLFPAGVFALIGLGGTTAFGAAGPDTYTITVTVPAGLGQTGIATVGIPVTATIQAMTGAAPPVPDNTSSASLAITTSDPAGATITSSPVKLSSGTGTTSITFKTAGSHVVYAQINGVTFHSDPIQVSAEASESTTELSPQFMRIIVGYEQSGANSANSVGRLYANAYYERVFGDTSHSFKKRLRAFGEAQIGSAAQNSASTVGNFVTGLSGAASNLKLNQVASVAEYLMGAEIRAVRLSDENDSRLSIFGEFGASGYLQSAELNNTFAFPSNTTQAYALLVAAEKNNPGYNPNLSSIPTTCVVGSSPSVAGVANNCMFVEFAQQQRYFDQEGYLGLKLVGYETDKASSASPDVVSVGFGTNQAVTANNRNFNVMRFEGFAPFAVPGTKPAIPFLYVFGYANLAFSHSRFPSISNFIPLNATSTVVVNNVAQTPSVSNTYVIETQQQPQEFYSVGVGVNLTDAWGILTGTGKKSD